MSFLFVWRDLVQSMYYGATARKIRSYWAPRQTARRGRAISFMEEIDAIAARGGLNQASASQVAACGGMQGPACGGADGPINASMVSEAPVVWSTNCSSDAESFDEPKRLAGVRQRIVGN
ncbi:MAG: hypothetical protein H6527_00970 [Actinobacteria bacterium]|nr:hypothetical protein [Actinomycetota bacterium]